MDAFFLGYQPPRWVLSGISEVGEMPCEEGRGRTNEMEEDLP